MAKGHRHMAIINLRLIIPKLRGNTQDNGLDRYYKNQVAMGNRSICA